MFIVFCLVFLLHNCVDRSELLRQLSSSDSAARKVFYISTNKTKGMGKSPVNALCKKFNLLSISDLIIMKATEQRFRCVVKAFRS